MSGGRNSSRDNPSYTTSADFSKSTGYRGVHRRGIGVFDAAALNIEEGPPAALPDLSDEFPAAGLFPTVGNEIPPLGDRDDSPGVDTVSEPGRIKTGHTAAEWGGASPVPSQPAPDPEPIAEFFAELGKEEAANVIDAVLGSFDEDQQTPSDDHESGGVEPG